MISTGVADPLECIGWPFLYVGVPFCWCPYKSPTTWGPY